MGDGDDFIVRYAGASVAIYREAQGHSRFEIAKDD